MEITEDNVFDIIDKKLEEYINQRGSCPKYLITSPHLLSMLKYWMMRLGAGPIHTIPNNYAGYPILTHEGTNEFLWVGPCDANL